MTIARYRWYNVAIVTFALFLELFRISDSPINVSVVGFTTAGFGEIFVNFFNNCTHYRRKVELIKYLANMTLIDPDPDLYDTCSVPKLPDIDASVCTNSFYGESELSYLETPRKVAYLCSFSFEVDALEILLNEIYDVVDYIFVFESKRTFGLGIEKPLMLDHLFKTSRFSRFRDRVVALEVGEELLVNPGSNIWKNEHMTETMRFRMFLKWNEEHEYFGDDDYVGFGDVDEIPWRGNVHILKHCRHHAGVDIGIWNTFSTVHKKHLGDFPVRGERFSVGDPTFYSIGHAKTLRRASRNRGHSLLFMKGGLHLTRYPYFPTLALKLITQTEHNKYDASGQYDYLASLINRGLDLCNISNLLVKHTHDIRFSSRSRHSPMDPDDIGKGIYKIPWFLECNKRRFPHFYNDHEIDPRLTNMCFLL